MYLSFIILITVLVFGVHPFYLSIFYFFNWLFFVFSASVLHYRLAGNRQAQSYCLLFSYTIVHNNQKPSRTSISTFSASKTFFSLDLKSEENPMHEIQTNNLFNHSRITKMIPEKIYVY